MPNVTGYDAVKAQETNIEKVIHLEAEQEKRVSAANRLSEDVGRFAGTNAFIVLQLAIVALWIVLNSRGPLGGFDRYPFPLLQLLLTLEAVLLTSFVLIRQNRMSHAADQRAHLDLQINLLAEKEITKVLQLLQRMSREMGIEHSVTDQETRELSKDTEVKDVARELQESLSENKD